MVHLRRGRCGESRAGLGGGLADQTLPVSCLTADPFSTLSLAPSHRIPGGQGGPPSLWHLDQS